MISNDKPVRVQDGVAQFTTKRILRDEDDASAQTVRSWTVTASDGHLTLTGGSHQDAHGPVFCRLADVDALIADLRRAADFARGEP
jgi:hypothetical protein